MNINRPCGTFDRTYFQAKELYRTPLRKILLALLIVGMYFLPFLAGDYGISILTLICAFTIGMLGLQIITGYCGQISIGHAAFMGVGMYTVGILQRHFGLSFWVCLPLAGMVPMFIGMMFGLPALRMKGLYLAFATLAAHFVIVYVISNWRSVTNGTDGMWMKRPDVLFGIDFKSDRNYYLLVLTITIIITYLATNLARTKMGRSFVAVRDNDIAAEVMGINIAMTKIWAFGVGCFFAGISGGLGGAYYEYVNIECFGLDDSIWYLELLVGGGSAAQDIAQGVERIAQMSEESSAAAHQTGAGVARGIVRRHAGRQVAVPRPVLLMHTGVLIVQWLQSVDGDGIALVDVVLGQRQGLRPDLVLRSDTGKLEQPVYGEPPASIRGVR